MRLWTGDRGDALWSRLRGLRWVSRAMWWGRAFREREQVEAEMQRELLFHLDHLTQEYLESGLSAEEARRAALRAMGNLPSIHEQCRDTWRWEMWDEVRQDVQFGWRSMRRHPGFALVSVLTLAIGIGADTATFSVINAVLLRPLALPTPERWVTLVEHRPPSDPFDGLPVSRPPSPDDTRELKTRTRTLSDVFLYGGAPEIRLAGREEIEPLRGAALPGDAMEVMGARPLLGRLFRRSEPEPVIVLSVDAWRRVFAQDPRVVGQTVSIDLGNVVTQRQTRVYTIVGVVAPGFAFPRAGLDYWMAGGRAFNVARLGAGVSLAAATAEVNALMPEITHRPAPKAGEPPRYELVPLKEALVGPVRRTLRLLGIAVGLLLLIACANVAGLLLSRALTRQREMAVRAALGAGRSRLVRQALTESLVLAVIGGVAGTMLAAGALVTIHHLLAQFAPGALVRQVGATAGGADGFPRLEEIHLDAQTLAFAVVLSLVTGVLFGLIPALRRTARLGQDALRAGSAAALTGFTLFRRHATRSLLVITQIALAMMLLASGGLLIHSAWKLLTEVKGFDPTNVLTFQLQGQTRRHSVQDVKLAAEELTARLRAIPGVTAAAYAHQLPLILLQQKTQMLLTPGERLPAEPGQTPPSVYRPDLRLVSREYFRVMGTRVIAGRDFANARPSDGTRTLVITESVARGRFGASSPIGRQVYLTREGAGPDPWTIIGIVEDVRQQGLDLAPQPQVFADLAPWPGSHEAFDVPQYFAIRVNRRTRSLVGAIRDALPGVDPTARLDQVFWMDDLIASASARPRVYAWLLGALAGVGVLLAAIGTYGVMSYVVSQATCELGVRLALGADRRDIFHLVLNRAAMLTGLGITLGLGGAAMGSRFLEGTLYGLSTLDPSTYLAMAALLALVALIASYTPARAATRVDPVGALRHE